MLITVKKEVEETIEVNAPCWLFNKTMNQYIHITQEYDLIKVSPGMIVLWSRDEINTKNEIRMALRDFHCCPEFAFKEALDKELFRIEETYTKA